MYKKAIAATALTLSLVLGSVTAVGAQQNTQQGPYNQAPGTTTGQQGQTGGTTDDNNILADWWWVLPLLAIPVIYLLTRRRDIDDRSEYRDERYAGAKGGKSRRGYGADEDNL